MQEVLEHCQLSSEMFTLYLQQNYLDFFDSTDDVVCECTWLCLCVRNCVCV